MKVIQVSLPEETLAAVRRSPDEAARDMQIAVAISWYARGLISQGKGAEIAGLTRPEFIDALATHGVPVCQETVEEIREVLNRG